MNPESTTRDSQQRTRRGVRQITQQLVSPLNESPKENPHQTLDFQLTNISNASKRPTHQSDETKTPKSQKFILTETSRLSKQMDLTPSDDLRQELRRTVQTVNGGKMSDMSETYLDKLLAQELLKNEKSRVINLNSKQSSDFSHDLDTFESGQLPFSTCPYKGRRLPGIDEEEFSVNTQLLSHILTRNGTTLLDTNKTSNDQEFHTYTKSFTEPSNRLWASTETEPPNDQMLTQCYSLEKKDLLEPIMEGGETRMYSRSVQPSSYWLHEKRARSKCYNSVYSMFLSSGGFYFGFYLSITSPVIRENYPQNFWSKTDQDPHGLSWVLLLAGMAFGPQLSGYFVDRIGRRGTIIANEFLIFCTFLGYFLMTNWYGFLATRFLTGQCSMVMQHTNVVLNKEIMPKTLTVVTSCWFYILSIIGIAISAWVERLFLAMKHNTSWFNGTQCNYIMHAILIWPILVHITRTVFILWIYKFDTPRYYILKYDLNNSTDKIIECLGKFYHPSCVKSVHAYLVMEHYMRTSPESLEWKILFEKTYR